MRAGASPYRILDNQCYERIIPLRRRHVTSWLFPFRKEHPFHATRYYCIIDCVRARARAEGGRSGMQKSRKRPFAADRCEPRSSRVRPLRNDPREMRCARASYALRDRRTARRGGPGGVTLEPYHQMLAMCRLIGNFINRFNEMTPAAYWNAIETTLYRPDKVNKVAG